jgi:hypothetical protein
MDEEEAEGFKETYSLSIWQQY